MKILFIVLAVVAAAGVLSQVVLGYDVLAIHPITFMWVVTFMLALIGIATCAKRYS